MPALEGTRYDILVASVQLTLAYLIENATEWDLFALSEVLSRHASAKARLEHCTRERGPQMQAHQMSDVLRLQMAEIERQTALMRAQQANCPPAPSRQEG